MPETKPMSTADFDEAAKKAAEEKEKRLKAEKEAAAKASGTAIEPGAKASDPAATPTAPYPSQAQADAIKLGQEVREVTAKEADKVDYKTR